jgi:putative phosphoribosyl transferase
VRFADRAEAGRELARALARYAGRPDVLVLALPRGGVVVGYEVARALGAPLDVFLVRKLGTPGHEELAMGAIASGGVRVMNDDVVRSMRVSAEEVRRVTEEEQAELARREGAYRGERPAPDVRGRTVLLVDDGLATGASMRAAVSALGAMGPAAVVVAVPTAPEETCAEFEALVDEMVCLTKPAQFFGVGGSYRDFSQTTDREVCELLEAAADREGGAP